MERENERGLSCVGWHVLGIIVKVGSHVFSSAGHKKVTNPSFVRNCSGKCSTSRFSAVNELNPFRRLFQLPYRRELLITHDKTM